MNLAKLEARNANNALTPSFDPSETDQINLVILNCVCAVLSAWIPRANQLQVLSKHIKTKKAESSIGNGNTRRYPSQGRQHIQSSHNLKEQALIMTSSSNPKNRLSSTYSIGEAGKKTVGSILRDLPLKWIHRYRDVHLAKEESENGERTKEYNKDV